MSFGKKSFVRAALGLAGAVSAFACAAPALAMDGGECYSMEQMNQNLRAEGQSTLVIGDRIAATSNERGEITSSVRHVNTVTSNPDGSLGYQIEGNNSRSAPSTNVCIASRLTNVRLFDARKPSIPRDAYLGGVFNGIVDRHASIGTRPMVIADTVHRDQDGSGYRRGLPLVLFGNMEGRSASIVTYDGHQAGMLALMNNTDYTPVALQRLGDRQLASLTP
jgi:hypothetical protein